VRPVCRVSTGGRTSIGRLRLGPKTATWGRNRRNAPVSSRIARVPRQALIQINPACPAGLACSRGKSRDLHGKEGVRGSSPRVRSHKRPADPPSPLARRAALAGDEDGVGAVPPDGPRPRTRPTPTWSAVCENGRAERGRFFAHVLPGQVVSDSPLSRSGAGRCASHRDFRRRRLLGRARDSALDEVAGGRASAATC
jgi:hypothetical protein